MIVSDLHTCLIAAQSSYIAGGAAWQISEGVQQALSYSALETFSAGGICIYGWIGYGESVASSDSPLSTEFDITIHARAKVIGDPAILCAKAIAVIEDICKMLLSIGNMCPCSVTVDSFEEPVIVGNVADVLVHSTAHTIFRTK